MASRWNLRRASALMKINDLGGIPSDPIQIDVNFACMTRALWVCDGCVSTRISHEVLSYRQQSGIASHMRSAARIRIARQRAGMSQKDLAARLGFTRGAVANWESASGVLPATERLQHIAHVTGITFEWLATGRRALQYKPSLDDIPAAEPELSRTRWNCVYLAHFPLRLSASIRRSSSTWTHGASGSNRRNRQCLQLEAQLVPDEPA
jgi:transcriptional regulator with XRE-family HTH domain